MSTQITRPWLRPFMAGLCLAVVISSSVTSGTILKSHLASIQMRDRYAKWQVEYDQGCEACCDTAYSVADKHFSKALEFCDLETERLRLTVLWYGINLYKEERDSLALVYLHNALRLTRKFNGNYAFDTALVAHWNARAQERVGRYSEAEKLYLETLSIYKETTNPLSSEYLYTSIDYANFLISQNRASEALPIAQEAYLVYKNDYGIHNRSTLDAGMCLAKAYNSLGYYTEAESLHNQNLELSRQFYGEKTLETAKCYLELANHCCAVKDFERADLLYSGIIDMLKVSIKPNQVLLIETERCFSKSLETQKKSDLAKEHLLKSLTLAQKRYEPRHPIIENIEQKLISFSQ